MNPDLLYRVYVSGEQFIVGYIKNNEPVMFTDEQIEELKKLSEDEQEAYALKLKGS